MDAKMNIVNEKNVTKLDILNEANEIYKKCKEVWKSIDLVDVKPKNSEKKTQKGKKQRNILETDHKKLDELFEKMRKEHKDFYDSYPTVLRHMIQDKKYSSKAFEKYLNHVEKNPWTKDEERMDSYTQYAVLLLIETRGSSHPNATEINLFKRDYRQRLQKEHDEFHDKLKELSKEQDNWQDELIQEKRKDLLETYRKITNGILAEDKIKQVEELANSGIIKVGQLENLVYDMKHVILGEPIENVIKNREEINEKIYEKMEQTDVSIPDSLPEDQKQKIKENINKVRNN